MYYVVVAYLVYFRTALLHCSKAEDFDVCPPYPSLSFHKAGRFFACLELRVPKEGIVCSVLAGARIMLVFLREVAHLAALFASGVDIVCEARRHSDYKQPYTHARSIFSTTTTLWTSWRPSPSHGGSTRAHRTLMTRQLVWRTSLLSPRYCRESWVFVRANVHVLVCARLRIWTLLCGANMCDFDCARLYA